jgi:hypothetical protein
MKRKDLNETAFAIVQHATGAASEAPDQRSDYQKAAAESGRRGGLKGGPARKRALTATRRSKIAKKAAKARWGAKT